MGKTQTQIPINSGPEGSSKEQSNGTGQEKKGKGSKLERKESCKEETDIEKTPIDE